ncbi:hypothetical protein [Amycolatopsis anabasis]|uniref:hypothetical protein n=1 Tax=Amycolatopsis anabasis TaxID=1840409 RepID=UPI00131D4037|nr:hypothetical protein [Amycolatopsis anabasis]
MRKALVREAFTWHRPLMGFAAAMTGLGAVSLGGLLLDGRELIGEPIWAKSVKFCISFTLYAITWSWMYHHLRRWRRTAWWGGAVFTVAGVVEMAVVVVQIARGERSHFNVDTPLDSALFDVMTASAIGLLIGHLLLVPPLLAGHRGDRAVTSAIRAGAALCGLGMALGVLMTGSNPRQRAVGGPGVVGAHTVGQPDGGPGIPILGWSTVGGDLRIPHFIGLHALQVLPLLVIALSAAATRWPRLADEPLRGRLVRIAAAGYLGLIALVTWQALRGQSLVHPDPLTLGAAAALLAAVLAAVTAALRQARETLDTPRKGTVTTR